MCQKKHCVEDHHYWVIAGIPFLLYDLDIADGTPCDCGKMLWHEEIICEHCGKKEFKPIERLMPNELLVQVSDTTKLP